MSIYWLILKIFTENAIAKDVFVAPYTMRRTLVISNVNQM